MYIKNELVHTSSDRDQVVLNISGNVNTDRCYIY